MMAYNSLEAAPGSVNRIQNSLKALWHHCESKGKKLMLAGMISAVSTFSQADIPSLPGAYVPLPKGTGVGLLHLQYAEADEVYNKGEKVADDMDISLKQAVFRYLHFEEWNGMPILLEGGVPISKQENGRAGDSWSGLGDAFFGGVLWPYSDRALGRFAGIGLRASAPTGDHKGEGFVPSNDRWAYNLQGAYLHRLGDSKWTAEGVAEYELSSDTDKTDIDTDPLYQIYAGLRYDASRNLSLSMQYKHKWGAEQKQDSIELHDGFDNSAFSLIAAGFVTPRVHLLGHIQRDLEVEQGPKLTFVQVRLGYLF